MKHKKLASFIVVATLVATTAGVAGLAFADNTTTNGGTIPSVFSQGQRQPGVMGTISAVSGNTITLSGKQGFGQNATDVTYTVDATNATFKKFTAVATGTDKPTETAISLSDLKIGDTIMVSGTVNGTTITATEICTGHPGKGPGGHQPGVSGVISSINGNTITLTYTIDATNATFKKFTAAATDTDKPTETAISLSDLKVGDTITAHGDVNGASVTAKEISTGRGFGGSQGLQGQPPTIPTTTH